MVFDTVYYDRLQVSPTATSAQIKRAYRDRALEHHPDKNPGDEAAHLKFQEIGEAYQVLSDPALRKRYDEFGLDQAAPSAGFEDPSELFNMIFGGNAFVDWVGELALMKDITDMMALAAKEEAEENAAKEGSHEKDNASTEQSTEKSTEKATEKSTEKGGNPATTDPLSEKTAGLDIKDRNTEENHPPSPPPEYTSLPRTRLALEDRPSNEATTEALGSVPESSSTPESELNAKKKAKERRDELAQQQDEEMRVLDEQRKKVREERVEALTKKLIDRLNIWTESDHEEDAVNLFRDKFRLEAENLKMESFGLGILHVIGETYARKSKNFLGMTRFGWFTGKWTGIKDVWNIVSTTLDVQRSVSNMAKMDEEGGENWTNERKAEMEAEVTGKILNAAWLGSRHEMQMVLREVCNNILEDEKVPMDLRVRRSQGMLMIGDVFLAVQRDPEDATGLTFEQLVAESASKKKEKKEKKKSRWNPFKSTASATGSASGHTHADHQTHEKVDPSATKV